MNTIQILRNKNNRLLKHQISVSNRMQSFKNKNNRLLRYQFSVTNTMQSLGNKNNRLLRYQISVINTMQSLRNQNNRSNLAFFKESYNWQQLEILKKINKFLIIERFNIEITSKIMQMQYFKILHYPSE